MASVSPYKKLLNRLKRLAPKVPDHTCPDIDFVIDKIETNKGFTRFRKKLLVRKLERLRTQNDDMRELGKFWFKKFKDYMREYLD